MPPKKPSAASKKSRSKLTMNSLDTFVSVGSSKSPTPPTSIPSLSQPSNVLKKSTRRLCSLPLVPDLNNCQDSKGKARVATPPISPTGRPTKEVEDEPLWVDKYAPINESELAVHKKKVEEVRRWLKEAFEGGPTEALKKYRRILALTGHAGTGKTATLKVLAKEMNFDIIEWRNAFDDKLLGNDDDDHDSLTQKFQTFFTRASSCHSLSIQTIPSSLSSIENSSPSRQVILLEDLPNILHPATAEAFHSLLEDYVTSSSHVPLVVIVSDAGVRGEDPESDTIGGRTWRRFGNAALDIRTVIPRTLINSPYFREIKFNPIAPTLMTKPLINITSQHFGSKAKTSALNKDIIQVIVESSNGDIRNAIMALQFACILQPPKRSKKNDVRALLSATQREQSLALFHLLGKILYNKRKGDPLASSTMKGARAKIEAADRNVPEPPPLPEHLAVHERRASRVNIETLYADSPVDTSLFALYLHQNYTQFCNETEECESLCEWLSWIDGGGAEGSQYQQNPYQFHILALGALQSLPSPVSRRSQKMFKPEFFETLKKTREAEVGIADMEGWLSTITNRTDGGRPWARDEIILELGALLKSLDMRRTMPPPRTHSRFTTLSFCHPAQMPSASQRIETLEEDEEPLDNPTTSEYDSFNRCESTVLTAKRGWLETDDIQEF